jgi:hypothetical protein
VAAEETDAPDLLSRRSRRDRPEQKQQNETEPGSRRRRPVYQGSKGMSHGYQVSRASCLQRGCQMPILNGPIGVRGAVEDALCRPRV